MLKEFMLFFALMLFALATYYVIQFAHGKAPVYTGVVAIISLIGSVAYPIYYFSPLNSAHREQVVDAIFPVGALVERASEAINGPLDAAEGRVRLLANDAGDVVNTGIDRATSGVANATFAYAGTALVSTALTTVAPAAAGVLAGPIVWLFAALAFLMGISRHPNRRVLGGKRKLRR